MRHVPLANSGALPCIRFYAMTTKTAQPPA